MPNSPTQANSGNCCPLRGIRSVVQSPQLNFYNAHQFEDTANLQTF